jgi:broad specificity phosphatase PhoE
VAWLESLPDAPHVVAVTHSGTIQMLLTHALGLETPRWRKRFSSVTRA